MNLIFNFLLLGFIGPQEIIILLIIILIIAIPLFIIIRWARKVLRLKKENNELLKKNLEKMNEK